MKKRAKKTTGWREWVSLPELEIPKIKAKVDTGARSSTLHAVHLRYQETASGTDVLFEVHTHQRNIRDSVHCRAKVLEFREIKSSNGHVEKRPVIVTSVELLGEHWSIEVTLTNRSSMGFRMLLGRESLRKRFLVDPGHSFLGNKRAGEKDTLK
ncbi:MAG: ATP-dependent zinc protease [Deltaproteobacteria bacterium]|nr:ATP-dependent zinc protease [Deltaproteobacteria bacterium]MBN2671419.1 ATP-dependent zinc protease [Deltaproteobacteria bacterium]